MATKAHPGFQALVKSGVPAGALANAARRSSAKAKAANPRLKKVSGVNKPPANVGAKHPVKRASKMSRGTSKMAGTKSASRGKRY